MSESSKKLYLVSLPFRLETYDSKKGDWFALKGYSDVPKWGIVEANSAREATGVYAFKYSRNVNPLTILNQLDRSYKGLENFAFEAGSVEEIESSLTRILSRIHNRRISAKRKGTKAINSRAVRKLAEFYFDKIGELKDKQNMDERLYGASSPLPY